MLQLYPKTTSPSDFKDLPNDIYLIGAFYERGIGWDIDCFVRGAANLTEALSFAVENHAHLNDRAVFATQIGGVRSLRQFAHVTQPEPPPPEVVLEDITKDVTQVDAPGSISSPPVQVIEIG